VAAAAVVITDGARPKPADPVEPLMLQAAEHIRNDNQGTTLRVATFNIHAGVGRDGIRDLERTAQCLPGLDVVALQEVRNPRLGFSGPQVSEVADKLGMAWVFVPAERQWWHNHYGTALLTRASLTDCVRIPLQALSRQRFRTAFLANFHFRGRIVHLLAVHLVVNSEDNTHEAQLRTAVDLFLSLAEPAILMGDFNEVRSHPQLVRLLGVPGVQNALANVTRTDVKKDHIDWIITRGFRTIHAEWTQNSASDHPVARAELELSATTPSKLSHSIE
jgi:endonuclease/exonuclease/phosphatase family metal-dependent hydrolase